MRELKGEDTNWKFIEYPARIINKKYLPPSIKELYYKEDIDFLLNIDITKAYIFSCEEYQEMLLLRREFRVYEDSLEYLLTKKK